MNKVFYIFDQYLFNDLIADIPYSPVRKHFYKAYVNLFLENSTNGNLTIDFSMIGKGIYKIGYSIYEYQNFNIMNFFGWLDNDIHMEKQGFSPLYNDVLFAWNSSTFGCIYDDDIKAELKTKLSDEKLWKKYKETLYQEALKWTNALKKSLYKKCEII